MQQVKLVNQVDVQTAWILIIRLKLSLFLNHLKRQQHTVAKVTYLS